MRSEIDLDLLLMVNESIRAVLTRIFPIPFDPKRYPFSLDGEELELDRISFNIETLRFEATTTWEVQMDRINFLIQRLRLNGWTLKESAIPEIE